MATELRNSSLRLEVNEAAGAAFSHCDWFDGSHWQPIMCRPADGRSEEGEFSSAMFPMVPFPNRARNNELSAGGTAYRVRPNTEEPYANHGVGWQRGWTVLTAGPESSRFGLQILGDYAFAFECEFTVSITSCEIAMELAIRNTSDRIIPVGLGLHPYFPRLPDTRLQFVADAIFPQGPDLLPTEPEPLWPDAVFGTLSLLPEFRLDNAFGGWDGTARIEQPTLGYVLDVTASSNCRELMLFAPEGQPYFALEPQTSTSGETNSPARPGRTGLHALDPGSEFRMDAVVRVVPLK